MPRTRRGKRVTPTTTAATNHSAGIQQRSQTNHDHDHDHDHDLSGAMKNLTNKQSQVLKRLVSSGRMDANGVGVGRTLASLPRAATRSARTTQSVTPRSTDLPQRGRGCSKAET
jgi:FixJ family two-component response regulator